MIVDIKTHIKLARTLLLHLYATISSRPLAIDDHILIIAPHPDDEVLGCSGLIQNAIALGKKVSVIILSDGAASHRGCCDIAPNVLTLERRRLTVDTLQLLSNPASVNLHFLNYEDGRIMQESPETEKLNALIQQMAPNAIYVPNLHERFPDHLEAQRIIRSLVRDSTVSIYEYCVWVWYFDSWNLLGKKGEICIMSKEQHELKNKMIDSYIIPTAPCGNPWSGILPKAFVKANRWRKELFFKIQ